MIKELNCSCICKEDVIIAVVDEIKDPKMWEIALIVIIVSVIIFILIIGFNKLKGDDEPESEESSRHTYY